MAEDRAKRYFYITLFVAAVVLVGGVVIFFSSERAIEAQREAGEGVLQEMTERQPGDDVPEMPDDAEHLEERQYGVTPEGNLLVEEWVWDTTGDDTFLRGAIRNLTGEEIGPVLIQFELQDGAGRVVGSAEDEVSAIRPQATWEYEIPVVNPQAAQAELREVVLRQGQNDEDS